jgi:hypothetical protein
MCRKNLNVYKPLSQTRGQTTGICSTEGAIYTRLSFVNHFHIMVYAFTNVSPTNATVPSFVSLVDSWG